MSESTETKADQIHLVSGYLEHWKYGNGLYCGARSGDKTRDLNQATCHNCRHLAKLFGVKQ